MRQYMQALPMGGAPAGPDMGGMLTQGINAYMGQKRQDVQDAQTARMQAMIAALKNPQMPGMGGVGSMSMPAEGMSMGSFGGGMPPVY